jgi:hypothetical protein
MCQLWRKLSVEHVQSLWGQQVCQLCVQLAPRRYQPWRQLFVWQAQSLWGQQVCQLCVQLALWMYQL